MTKIRLARHHQLGTLLTTDEREIPKANVFVLSHFSFAAMLNAQQPADHVAWMLRRYGQAIRPEDIPGWDILDPGLWKDRPIPSGYEHLWAPPVWDDDTVVKGIGVTFGESALFREASTQSGSAALSSTSGEPAWGQPFELKDGTQLAFSVARPYKYVFGAPQPEIFEKGGLRHHGYIVGPGSRIGLHAYSRLMVNEAEKTQLVDPSGRLIGHTNGNDATDSEMESEDILYLHRAKCFPGCAALGPWLELYDEPFELDDPREPLDREMRVTINTWDTRNGAQHENDGYPLSKMQRTYQELAWWLGQEDFFSAGVYAMCGTGCAKGKALNEHHNIHIHSPGVGTLVTGTRMLHDRRPRPAAVRDRTFHVTQ